MFSLIDESTITNQGGWAVFMNTYDPCHPWSARWKNTWDGYNVFAIYEQAATYAATHPDGPTSNSTND